MMNKIKMLRSEKGLTLRDMAKEARVGVATLVRLESNKKANSITLAKVAKVLGIEMIELTEFEAAESHKAKKPPRGKPKPTPPPPPPEPEPVKQKFTGQVKDSAWAVGRELNLTFSQVKNYMIKNPSLMSLPYEELKKAVAEKFKK
jgi:DNA-binding XRE family transcriptional regulator